MTHLLLLVLAAGADRPPALFLEWSAPGSCPDRAWVLAEVARLRGTLDVREEPAGADVVAQARVELSGSRFAVSVQTHSTAGEGTRSLEADTCQRAAEAATLVLSLALAPFAPPPPPSPPAAPEPPAPEPAPPPVRWRVTAALLATARLGPLRDVAPGGALAVAVSRDDASLEVQAHTPALQSVQGNEVALPFAAGLAGCYRFLRFITACVELDLGWARGRGAALREPRESSGLWLAVLAAARGHLPLYGPLHARLELAAGASLSRPSFVFDTDTVLYQVPWFTGRAGAGLELVFP